LCRALFFITTRGIPPLPEGEFSPELVDFVDRCLVRDGLARPSAEDLLAHPFLNQACREDQFAEIAMEARTAIG
jgi:serine/threonine protein kinase